ncbi:DNA recombination protein RmuC [Parvularcula maris]|uniref:DNA recombination protein RmuC homolog n=1 Tax=Parvularcula maris TaxID=2965077 RepID=A0A9X2LAW7_9PROT|nr:DNA recombination protein RmuC [Parvularcula maris]MCQ8186353.1 DNA recombination protein RmuC [Parvularcula maris]
MAWNLNPFGMQRVEIVVDEALGDALEQVTGANETMASGGHTLQYIILAVVGLAVLGALAITYFRLNRRKNFYDDSGDLFDQGFDTASQSGFSDRDDDFSSIRITREERAEPGPLTTEVEPDPYYDEPELAAPPMSRDPEAAPNVVPLRTPEPEPEPEPVPEPQPLPRVEPRREAAIGESRRDDFYQAPASSTEWDRPQQQASYQETRSSSYDDRLSAGRYEDQDAPFMAPFIKDYIEESERRQHSRLDDLRDDMRRQLTGIRDEQSSRLDLFLSSIDRKLDRHGIKTDDEDGAATRRRIDSLTTMVERVTDHMKVQGDRLDDLSRVVGTRLDEMAPIRADLRSMHDEVLSFRRDVEASHAAIGQIRDNFDGLKEDFGRLERSFLERAQSDGSVTMRLSEVVRSTLDDDEYELNARLSNGQIADCVIGLSGGRSKVAIDGGFPIESFNRLPSRDAVRKNMPQAKKAEDDFRRTVLRSIFSVADRCIVRGETADSAILFLPSEAAYTILHDRFPDLVRDSHRARVWLTSPSTLMGTLNLLHNVLPEDDHAPQSRSYERFDEGGGRDLYFEDDEDDYRAEERSRQESRAEDLEARLRRLREEEQELARELSEQRGGRRQPTERRESQERRYRRDPAALSDDRVTSRRRRETDEERTRDLDASGDFETRLERFSFDLDDRRRSDDDEEGTYSSPREDRLR